MIVITDDHVDSAEYLARLLRRVGHPVAVESSGSNLLARLSREPASLIILDVMMPEMDGIECLRRIRENPAWSGVPVIMYSADFAYERMRDATRLGAQEYVVKGSTLWPDFLATIRKYVAAAQPPDSPNPPPHPAG